MWRLRITSPADGPCSHIGPSRVQGMPYRLRFPSGVLAVLFYLVLRPRKCPDGLSPTSAGVWPVRSLGGTGCRTATLGHLFIPSAPSRPGLWWAVAVCLSWRPQLLPRRLRCAGFQEPWPPLPLGSWGTGPVAFCRCQPEPPPSRASVSSPWPS